MKIKEQHNSYVATCFGTAVPSLSAESVTSLIAFLRLANITHDKGFRTNQPINLLKTKGNLLYIRDQSAPRCKHFPPRL